MAQYPTNLSPPSNIEESFNKPLRKSRSVGGYSISYGGGTLLNKKWRISYNFLSDNDKTILESFFNTYAGEIITWTHFDSSEYNVLFGQNRIKFIRIGINRWKTDIIFIDTELPGLP